MDDIVESALRMSAATQLMARVISGLDLTDDEKEAVADILTLIARRMGSVAVKASL